MASGATARPRLIAGLIPEPTIPMADEMRRALDARRNAIEQRVTHLAKQALAEQPTWLRELGPQPADQAGRARWNQALHMVVVYRDINGIVGDQMLGGKPRDRAESDHRQAVRRAIANISRDHSIEPELASARLASRSPALSL